MISHRVPLVAEQFHHVRMYFKGDLYTVVPSAEMRLRGWRGGQGLMWTDSDEWAQGLMTVTYSDGRYGGFALKGSDEPLDTLTSLQGSQTLHRYLTICAGGCLIATRTFEQHTWASRQGGGPLEAITYRPNDVLYFSLRGYWTKEDEATLAGRPYAPLFFAGYVAQVPSEANDFYLGVQTGL